jgi:hypothetical protein
LDSEVLVHTHSPPHQAKVIGLPSYDRPDIYTVLFKDGSIAKYSDSNNILEATSIISTTEDTPLLPNWVQDGTNATLRISVFNVKTTSWKITFEFISTMDIYTAELYGFISGYYFA